MTRKIIAVQHLASDTLGAVGDALNAGGVGVEFVRTYEGQSVPKELGDAAGLVVLGGTMSATDSSVRPHLRDELRLITAALDAGAPVLGVCLGCQLLAKALGRDSRDGDQMEVGFCPVRLAPAAAADPLWSDAAQEFVAFHWHGDTFDLPAGAELLASSDLYAHQAFRHGSNAYGVQFHLEMTSDKLADLVRSLPDKLAKANRDGATLLDQSGRYLPESRRVAQGVFGRWVASLPQRG